MTKGRSCKGNYALHDKIITPFMEASRTLRSGYESTRMHTSKGFKTGKA